MITVFGKVLMFVNKRRKDGTFSLRLAHQFQCQNISPDNLLTPRFNFRVEVVVQNEGYVNSLPADAVAQLKLQAEDQMKEYFLAKVAPSLKPVFH